MPTLGPALVNVPFWHTVHTVHTVPVIQQPPSSRSLSVPRQDIYQGTAAAHHCRCCASDQWMPLVTTIPNATVQHKCSASQHLLVVLDNILFLRPPTNACQGHVIFVSKCFQSFFVCSYSISSVMAFAPTASTDLCNVDAAQAGQFCGPLKTSPAQGSYMVSGLAPPVLLCVSFIL